MRKNLLATPLNTRERKRMTGREAGELRDIPSTAQILCLWKSEEKAVGNNTLRPSSPNRGEGPHPNFTLFESSGEQSI